MILVQARHVHTTHPVKFHWSRSAASLACRMNCFRFMQLAALFVFTVYSRAADPAFAGAWETTYGHMELKLEGTAVRGTYQSPGGAANDIRGTLDGLKLTFTYTESTGDKGTAEFKLAEDGATFMGTWKVAKSKQGGAWEGTRVKPVAGRTWLVVLEAHWESSLQGCESARNVRRGVRHRAGRGRDGSSLRAWRSTQPRSAVYPQAHWRSRRGQCLPRGGSVRGRDPRFHWAQARGGACGMYSC